MSVNDKVSFYGVLISIHVHDPTRRTLANITHCFPSTSRMRIYVARVSRVVNRWSCEERKRDSIRWAAWRKLGHRVVSRYCWPYEFFNSPFDQSSVYESRISTVVKSIPPAVADWRLLVFFLKTLHIEFCHSLIFLLFYLSFFFIFLLIFCSDLFLAHLTSRILCFASFFVFIDEIFEAFDLILRANGCNGDASRMDGVQKTTFFLKVGNDCANSRTRRVIEIKDI